MKKVQFCLNWATKSAAFVFLSPLVLSAINCGGSTEFNAGGSSTGGALGGTTATTGGRLTVSGGSVATGGKSAGTGGKTLGTGGSLATGGGTSGTGGTATGGSQSTGGATTNTGGQSNPSGGTSASGGSSTCPPLYVPVSSTVLLPEANSPTDVAATCGLSGFSATAPAVRISLLPSDTSPTIFVGTATVAPELVTTNSIRMQVQGVEIFAGNGATISGATISGGVFTFQVTWPGDAPPSLADSLTFQVSLLGTCGPQYSSVRQITVRATVEVCGSSQNRVWVTSGDTCTICQFAAGA